jgi:hypothetical protein
MTFFREIDWWVSGAKIPGKAKAVSFYVGNSGENMKYAEASAREDYKGYELTKEAESIAAQRRARTS